MNNNKENHSLLAAAQCLSMAAIAISLAGCEAALDLSGVNTTLDNPIRRTDQIQGLAQNTQAQVAVGNFGLVLHRTRGSEEWHRLELPGQPGLIDIATCPDEQFVALGFERDLWLGDKNAGRWQSKPIPTSENLLAVTCSPDGTIWAVGSFSSFYSSSDEGDSWAEFSLNEDAMLTSIQFLTADIAYAAGEFGLVIKTEDAGQQWQVLAPIQAEFYPQTTFFSDEQTGWAVGLDGTVYQTTDGAGSWQLSDTGVDAPLYQVIEHDSNPLLLGDNATVLTRTADQWQPLALSIAPVFLRAGLVDNQQLLLAGGNGVLLSVDLRGL